MTENTEKPLILFDGFCNLCSRSVQVVIKNDPHSKFKLGSLQGEEGRKILDQFGLKNKEFTSFILIDKGKVYKKSGAALRVARKMAGLWPLLYFFIWVPGFIRNAVYDFIARNRYKWFGKRDTCWLPDPELQNRFID